MVTITLAIILFLGVKGAILQSQDFDLCVSEKLIRWPLMINAKTYLAAKAEGMCKIVKKLWSGIPPKLEISNLFFIEAKSTPQNLFIIFRFFFHV